MKSIKEKTEEYVSGFHPSIQKMCKESFEEGANYVLEEVERLLNSQRFVDSPSKELFELIEQLKK